VAGQFSLHFDHLLFGGHDLLGGLQTEVVAALIQLDDGLQFLAGLVLDVGQLLGQLEFAHIVFAGLLFDQLDDELEVGRVNQDAHLVVLQAVHLEADQGPVAHVHELRIDPGELFVDHHVDVLLRQHEVVDQEVYDAVHFVYALDSYHITHVELVLLVFGERVHAEKRQLAATIENHKLLVGNLFRHHYAQHHVHNLVSERFEFHFYFGVEFGIAFQLALVNVPVLFFREDVVAYDEDLSDIAPLGAHHQVDTAVFEVRFLFDPDVDLVCHKGNVVANVLQRLQFGVDVTLFLVKLF